MNVGQVEWLLDFYILATSKVICSFNIRVCLSMSRLAQSPQSLLCLYYFIPMERPLPRLYCLTYKMSDKVVCVPILMMARSVCR